MASFLRQTTFLSFIIAFGTLFVRGNARLGGAVRRQVYFGSSDGLLKESTSDVPAPIVLPSGIVPDAGAVAPAGAIAPSPLIAPAPAILPANAINEKNRATPTDKGKAKRFQLPFTSDIVPSQWNGALPRENVFSSQTQLPDGESALSLNPNEMSSPGAGSEDQNQFASPQTMPIVPNEMFEDSANHDQLSSTKLAFLQGQYNAHKTQAADKVDYFEPNYSEGTPPFLDSTYSDTGPSKEDLKRIQPILDSENNIADAIIKDSWREDNALTSSRQAVSEGLSTAHQLAKADLKNKPIVQQKHQQPSNGKINNNNNDNINTDFLPDEEEGSEMHKQESPPSIHIEQGNLPLHDIGNNSNFFLDQTRPVNMHKQETHSSHSPAIKLIMTEKNPASTSLKIHTDKPHSQRLTSSPSSTTSAVLQNNLRKKNTSENFLHKEWFANVTLSKSNISLENNTASSPKNDQNSQELYTAADYLQTLYPQLSAFKAPLEKIKGNASLHPSMFSSFHDNVKVRKLISLAPKLDTKHILERLKQQSLRPDKFALKMKLAAEKQLLASLEKANSMLGERSAIKQNRNAPKFKKFTKLLLARSKQPRIEVPGYRYLTESGAKLLPAHIFSPLGSAFGDKVQPTSTPVAKTTISTAPATATVRQRTSVPPILPTQAGEIQSQTQKQAEKEPNTSPVPLILPTQAGEIQSQTQGQAEKEPDTSPVIVPTQSGMIVTAGKVSGQNKLILGPTSKNNDHASTSGAFVPPTSPTKLVFTKGLYAPTQSGSIPAQPLPVKTALPTGAPLVPTQIGFIPTQKYYGNIWTGTAENNSERKDGKPWTNERQRWSSHRKAGANQERPQPGLTHFHVQSKKKGKTNNVPNTLHKSLEELAPSHSRKKRQLFFPVSLMQTSNNPQQLSQALLPGQLAGQPLIPQLPQLEQPVQPFLPTQPLQGLLPNFVQSPQAMDPMSLLGQQDVRSQLPLQQPFNQITQTLFTPQQPQNQGLSFGNTPAQLPQLSNSIRLTPYQHLTPDQMPLSITGYPQRNEARSIDPAHLSPISVDVPMTAPRKIPSFLTASQVYKDFEDVNSRSHLADDIFGGEISRGDFPRNDYAPEDDFPDEPKYDKFAYENDKKMYGMDNDFPEDEGADILKASRRKHRKPHYLSDYTSDDYSQPDSLDAAYYSPTKLRYGSEGRRHHRPRSRHMQHWVNENTPTRVNGKEIIGHNKGEEDVTDDDIFHVAEDTTENPIKEDSYETPPKYHQRSKHKRPGLDDDITETNQSEKSSSDNVKDSDQSDEDIKSNQSESRESDETESETDSLESETQSESDSSESHQAVGDKSEKHEELRDGLEETAKDESSSVSIKLPKPATYAPTSETLQEEIIKKLSRSAVMHLNFDTNPVKHGEQKVQDDSGNKNDAALVNGAEISNRTMGSCGRVAVLTYGEVVYKAEHFTRKPTKAASIAMWVKSSKPGLVRWFDVGDSGTRSPIVRSHTKHSNGKLVKVPKNQWIHLAGTFDSKNGIARVYVNGKLISETVGKKNQGLPEDFTATGIGQKFGDKFISFLDDVFMFDRVISPAEVRMLHRKCEFNRMVLHFGFQKVNTTTRQLMDQSGLNNNATISGGAHILNSGCDKCGACLDASSDKMPGVYLDGRKFHHKPASAISVASWISLNQTKGRHSIFQAVSNKNDEWHDIYNLDVVNGKLLWRHKNANSDIIFDVKTDDMVIPEGLWSHVTATYNSDSGDAKIYVNGLLKASFHNAHKPKLNIAWGRMSIGGHLPDARNFGGLLDEFFMYNWELDPSEVRFVLKYCADKPKLVSFTVRVPLFKRQRVQKAPQVVRYL